ncbi:hypothetical protein LC087_13030 [Bacillus carboniphilus]|uniref:Uncharacterized protein n=1 Tax=Bacillus carboniphilus TaxID=86663 RepID=A0ABY9JQV6_9BACI|nr:hypothetical protein [Bacillus carboniphilus]WLR41771.1 hypothetical protein LC087_13030 [Bacillus carboniphilus]
MKNFDEQIKKAIHKSLNDQKIQYTSAEKQNLAVKATQGRPSYMKTIQYSFATVMAIAIMLIFAIPFVQDVIISSNNQADEPDTPLVEEEEIKSPTKEIFIDLVTKHNEKVEELNKKANETTQMYDGYENLEDLYKEFSTIETRSIFNKLIASSIKQTEEVLVKEDDLISIYPSPEEYTGTINKVSEEQYEFTYYTNENTEEPSKVSIVYKDERWMLSGYEYPKIEEIVEKGIPNEIEEQTKNPDENTTIEEEPQEKQDNEDEKDIPVVEKTDKHEVEFLDPSITRTEEGYNRYLNYLQGNLRSGMTQDEVKSILGDQYQTAQSMVNHSTVNEYWSYDIGGEQGYSFHSKYEDEMDVEGIVSGKVMMIVNVFFKHDENGQIVTQLININVKDGESSKEIKIY